MAMEALGAIERNEKATTDDGDESSAASVATNPKSDNDDDGTDDDGTESEEEEEDEDDEPQLKYLSLTKNLGSLHRGGDATSCSLVGGDKMVCRT